MISKERGTKSYTIYMMLMIIIPGLILIGISLISITKQKTSRILDLNKDLSNKVGKVLEEIEEEIENSFNKTLSEIKKTGNFKNFGSESYINFFKKIMFENHFITYPFIINNNGEYIFPIQQRTNTKEKLLEKVSKITSLEKLIKSNKSIEKNYTVGEKNEFGNKKYLLAIKSYLKVLSNLDDPLVKSEILYAISRCYRKNENFNQAIAYLDEIIMIFTLKTGSNYLEFKVLYDKANCYDRLGQRSESISIYIDLYDRILRFENLTKRNDYSSLKAGVLQYLEKNIKKIEKFRSDFEKVKKDDGLSGLSDIEIELNWSYSNIENILRKPKKTDLDKISKVERFRLNRIKEFYLSSDDKTVYYRNLLNSDFWLDDQIEPLSINSKVIKTNKDKIDIIYSKVILENQAKPVYFGYWISLLKIKSELIPDLSLKHLKNNNLKLDMETDVNSSDFENKNVVAFSDFKKYIPDTRLYLVSNKANYLNTTIKKDLILNYLIVFFLLLMLIFGVFLFIRIFNKERKLLRMKSDFVDSVSHTLKTPLTRIRLITEKLELGWTKDTRSKEEMLRIIQMETELMSESIENMLSFSKIDSGKLKYRKNPLDMSAYLKELIANYESYLNSKGFTIEIHISEAIPIIHFDKEAFKLIFINLMQNSIKYSMEEKEIIIELILSENKIVFKVADRGIGISAKNINSVFEKFFRADDNLVKTIEGSGLGLFLVKHAVIAHNGKIELKNRRDGGLEVQMSFPVSMKVKK